MNWLSERWEAFSDAAGPKRYVIGATVSVVIALSGYILPVVGTSITTWLGVPPPAVGVGFAFILVVHWLLGALVQLRTRIKHARVALARLRAEGVAIRNDGPLIRTRDQFSSWQTRALHWNEQVIAAISDISEADAQWFSILDIVPAARIELSYGFETDVELGAEFFKLFREHDFRVKRLGKMIYRLWGK